MNGRLEDLVHAIIFFRPGEQAIYFPPCKCSVRIFFSDTGAFLTGVFFLNCWLREFFYFPRVVGFYMELGVRSLYDTVFVGFCFLKSFFALSLPLLGFICTSSFQTFSCKQGTKVCFSYLV